MSFADDVTANTPPGPVCSVRLWRDSQPADVQTEFDAIITDSRVQSSAIWRAMRKHGYEKAAQMLERHRRGDCKCPSLVM